MKFIQDITTSKNDFGYELVIRLESGWKDAARKYPREKLKDILCPEVEIAQRVLDESGLKQKIELQEGEFGLHHINLLPDRAGLDLFESQHCYISHNLTRASQPAALQLIIVRYLIDLGYFTP